MRVNHAGEIAAQALYHGQALMARTEATRQFLLRAAAEEGDHLAWCEQRLRELGDRTSLLNPFWYAGAFAIGAGAAALSDRLSLGFVRETERQVEGHLAEHLARLPAQDARSRRILEIMQREETGHAQAAQAVGGAAAAAAHVDGFDLEADDAQRLLCLTQLKSLAVSGTYVIKSSHEQPAT
jgi:ubiquinone biosynthesis monooxygenase Coq7